MKLGFISSIFDTCSFEEVIEIAAKVGLSSVELACWPNGDAQRKYAGVSHLNPDLLDDEKTSYILDYCEKHKVQISSLAYYPNNMDPDTEKREYYNNHLKKLIVTAEKLNINMVTTFIGRVQNANIDENFELFPRIWKPIIQFAEDHGVKIAIENCPMLFTDTEWPGGHNIATSPVNWRRMFDLIPSCNLGLNFDPSHFVWQSLDYIDPIYEFREKLFHIHFKDVKIHEKKLKEYGILATPLKYMSPKLPGLGDVNWSKFISALTDVGYDGFACIEIEDSAFEGTMKKKIDSLRLSKKYLEQFVVS